MPHIALLSYSLSPLQVGTQSAMRPEWQGCVPMIRETSLANCRRRTRESTARWSLSLRHPASKMQGLGLAQAPLSGFNQRRALVSPLPPALAHFRNLAKVSDNVIFNLLQAGLESHVRDSEGNHTCTPAPWPVSRELDYTPLPTIPKGCRNVSPLALHFEIYFWWNS